MERVYIMIYDVVILGGGIAGLNAMYRIQQHARTTVLLLEKEPVLGGRIHTYTDKHMQVEAGAGRFCAKHSRLLALIAQLGLTSRMTEISADSVFMRATSHGDQSRVSNSVTDAPRSVADNVRAVDDLLFASFPDIRPVASTLLDATLGARANPAAGLIAELIVASKFESPTVLRNICLLEYAKRVFKDTRKVQFIQDTFGYYSELVIMNAFDALRLIDTLSPTNQFYSMQGGLSTIIDRLRASAADSTTIMRNKDIVSVKHVAGSRLRAAGSRIRAARRRTRKRNMHGFVYQITCADKTQYLARKCICALPKPVVEKMPIFKPIRTLLSKIVCGSLCRIYSKFEPGPDGKVWFADLPKLTTDNDLRIVIPYDTETGVIMISYSDNKYADKWNDMYETHGVQTVNIELVRHVLATTRKVIPMPAHTRVFYWKCGVGYWGIGANSAAIAPQLVQPSPKQHLYLCGESYSETNQQWIEGALETSDEVVRRIFDKSRTTQ